MVISLIVDLEYPGLAGCRGGGTVAIAGAAAVLVAVRLRIGGCISGRVTTGGLVTGWTMIGGRTGGFCVVWTQTS
jgi:hypothetical protein